MRKVLALVGFLLVLVAPSVAQNTPLKVVASTSIIADVVKNVGGDLVEVSALVPSNTDVHAFQITPDDVRRVEEADVLLVNGLGLEAFLGGLLDSVDTPQYEISNGIAVLAYGGHDHDHESGDMHDHSMEATEEAHDHDHSMEATATPEPMGGMGHSMGGGMAMGAMTGGYALVENKTASDIVLLDVMGMGFGEGEIHETQVVNEVARMIHMENGLVIPANGSIELKPGSFHMMFLDVQQTLAEGSTLPLTLVFGDGSELAIEAQITMMGGSDAIFENDSVRVSGVWVRPVEVAGMGMNMMPEATAEATDMHDHSAEAPTGHMHEGGNYLGYYGQDVMCEAHDHAEGEAEHSHAEGECDPHVWTDPKNVMVWAHNIAEILGEIDPTNAEAYMENAHAYIEELEALNAEVKMMFEAIPAENRIIVTNHEFLGYFAVHYGFEVVGVVIPSGTTSIAPTPQELAGLVETIKSEGVKAIFTENSNINQLAEVVSQEVGEEVKIYTLYTDSLGDSPADTYIGYLRANAETIVSALSGMGHHNH